MTTGDRAREIIADAGIDAIDVLDGKKGAIDHSPRDPATLSGNWGIYAQPDDDVILVDIDDYGEDPSEDEQRSLDAIRALPATYTQKSPHGGTHRVYLVETGDDRSVSEHLEYVIGVSNPKPSWGELRVANQYIVGAGSELAECGKDWHDCSDPKTDSSYQIADDSQVETIHISRLTGALAIDPEILSGDDSAAHTGNTTRPEGSSADDVDLDVSRVETGYTRGERDEHPVHGSNTGTNFKIDEDDETWRCWRHDVTGNALHLVGMEAGIINCGDWKGSGLDTDTWSEIFTEARNRGLIEDNYGGPTADDLAGNGDNEQENTDVGNDEPSLHDSLSEDEWFEFIARDDIRDAVVRIPNPDYEEGEDKPSEKYIEDYRSQRSLAQTGVDEHEEIVAVYDDKDRRLEPYQVKVELREDAEAMVCRRIGSRDNQYIQEFDAAQQLLTRMSSAFQSDDIDSNKARHMAADAVDEIVELLAIPEEDDELWIYSSETGAWEPRGETAVRSICEEALGPHWTTTVRREVLSKLRDRHRESAETAWQPRATVPDDVLPVANGLVKLPTNQTGRAGSGPELIEHTAAARSRHALPVEYDPDADKSEWRRFTLEITADREGYAHLLDEIVGQILLPDNRNPCLPILYGSGSNGKMVLDKTLSEFTGRSVSNVGLEKLEDNRFALDTLVGNMVNIVPDVDATRLTSINVTKSITGGDQVEVEPKGGKSYMVRPRTTLIYGANRPPMLPESNNAIKRRLLPIPLPVDFVPDPDPDDPYQQQRIRNREQDLLTPEAQSGLLLAALEGLDRYEQQGEWSHPLSRDERVAQYTKTSDAIVAACDDLLVEQEGVQVPKAAVYDAYVTYARDIGRDPVQPSTFWRRYGKTELPSRFRRIQTPGGETGDRERVVHGVALTADAYRRLSGEWRAHEWVVEGCRAAGEFDDVLNPGSPTTETPTKTVTDGGQGGESAQDNTTDTADKNADDSLEGEPLGPHIVHYVRDNQKGRAGVPRDELKEHLKERGAAEKTIDHWIGKCLERGDIGEPDSEVYTV